MSAKQTRKASLAETLLNATLGYGVAVVAQVVIFPWFGIDVPLSSNLAITLLFAGVSLVRGFVLRRLFEVLRVKGILV